jgi:integrase
MNAHLPACRVTRADAERALERHVGSIDGQSGVRRALSHQTLRRFLTDLAEPGGTVVLLSEDRLLQWMIRDAASHCLTLAVRRLILLGDYLRALTDEGLVGADFMAAFRARHGNRTWRTLVRALQSRRPAAQLAALRPDPRAAGPLEAHVRPYLELQRSLGKRYHTHRTILNLFSRFLHARGVRSPRAVAPDLIQQWLDARPCGLTTQRAYASLIGRFFGYLRQLGVVADNPATPVLFAMGRPRRPSFRPFIFTREQVAALLARARQLPPNGKFPLRGLTCYTMLALLYALGLRHGEARHLRIRDLDLGRQTLFINQTKFHKSRYVPFGPRVGACLSRFLKARRTVLAPLREDDPLFVTAWRRPFEHDVLREVLQASLPEMGVAIAGGRRGPRLHDLRHTFAVHRPLRWYREGIDVQSRLPALAAFMGHVRPESTQVYLTITTELLQEANARFHRHFGRLFDEGRP